ncbi:MAG: glycine hydroxymethyltransferase [Defluviitaleaceae bacterium]|nr:glycine hydroxymethyltransferase [Defluviitaleaceae bacterium]MCL2239783.1 glycine hydroxymethyltransferase [Defluviitaleaceae bacterium]
MEILKDYMTQLCDTSRCEKGMNPEMMAFAANLDVVARTCPDIAKGIIRELLDQRSYLKLIASENYCSYAVQSAMGNLLTDKYAEGYVGKRFYAGCDNIDEIERIACAEAKALFGAEHAYVQPHSGADANMVAFWAILRAKVQAPMLAQWDNANLLHISDAQWNEIRHALGNQKIMGMDLYSGGHLTHGYRHNISGQLFDVHFYHVNQETGLLDYEALRKQLHEVRPLILLTGFSAYSRNLDFALLRQYADEVDAVLMVDMAHFAGLVAGKALTGKHNPIPYADLVTTTTHKTLRGPRGGMVLCKEEYREYVDKGCPHVLGGPLPHVMAAKAIAFKEANAPAFRAYAANVIENARALAATLVERGAKVQTGGTDNHIVLVEVGHLGITGTQAENALRECGLTLNRNTIPGDKNGPWITSGLRLGTPALTSLGMGKAEMVEVGNIIADAIAAVSPKRGKNGKPTKTEYNLDAGVKSRSLERVRNLLGKYVLYPELDGAFLARYI